MNENLQNEKKKKENLDYTISDLIGFRIVCLYQDEVSKIAENLKTSFNCLDVTDKTGNIQASDNEFGYLSVHLDLCLTKKHTENPVYKNLSSRQFEVQIRSISQNAWSEIDHGLKYKKSNLPNHIKRRVNRLAAVYELADQEFLAIRQEIEREEQDSHNNTENEEPISVITLNQITIELLGKELGSKADSLYETILASNPFAKNNMIKEAIRINLSLIKSFQNDVSTNEWNPETLIKHCLYHSDNRSYDILSSWQKISFKSWVSKQKIS